MADLSFWHQYKKAFAAQPNKKGTPDHYYSGQFSDPPPACYEPGHTCHLSKKSPIPEKRRMTNFKEMRGGEDRELSGRSNFLIDSAREKGGGGNFLIDLIRNSKEKGGGRTQSSGDQFSYCFS